MRSRSCHDRPVRSLLPAPRELFHPETGRPAVGSYTGALPRVGLGALPLRDRILRRKKWLYVGIATERFWISLAIVRSGYAASTFAFVFDARSRSMRSR